MAKRTVRIVRATDGDLTVRTSGRTPGRIPPPVHDSTLMAKPSNVRAWDMAGELRDGATLEEVAERYGISRGQVVQRLSYGGWSSTGHPRPVPVHNGYGKVRTVEDVWPDWMLHGVCRQVDPELWFPEKGESTKPAKKICDGCPVRRRCRSFALENDVKFGVWGGMSVRELEELRKRRLKSAEEVA